MKTITIEVDDTVHELLQVLTYTGALDGHQLTVEQVVGQLIDHAQQGVYRPGAWERDWLVQAFGDYWTTQLERGDPYGRQGKRLAAVFQRPKQGRLSPGNPAQLFADCTCDGSIICAPCNVMIIAGRGAG